MKLTGFRDTIRKTDSSNSLLVNQRLILIMLTFGGSVIVLSWGMFDRYYLGSHSPGLDLLRWITVGVYAVNLGISLIRKSARAIKQHLVAGFYFGTVFCMLLVMFTGAGASPYWYSLFFIIIGWFVLVPYPPREMTTHSLVFVFIFLVGQYSQNMYPVVHQDLMRMVFLYSGALFVGLFAAYNRDRLDRENARISENLDEKNRELQLVNRDLLESERDLKKFKLVIDQAPGAVFIMDKKWEFEYINPEFTRLSGYREEELLHKSIQDTLYKGSIPESRRGIIDAVRSGKRWQGDLVTRKKNGENYWVSTIAAPFRDEKGEIDGYIIIQQDITEKKCIETALQTSEEKYRTLIEKAVDGIIITQKGLLKFVNGFFCDLIQYAQEELIEQPYLQFVHPDDHQMMIDYHKRRMEGEDFQAIYRSRIIRKDGSHLPVELNTRTSDYNGEPAAFIIVRDLSERISNEEELRQAKAKLEDLNRNLEHRIRESSERLTEANTQLIRLQKENLQSQFEVLRQQVNPHFLFNSLNVLTSLIKLEPDLAEKYTEHLSKVYRYVLENKEHDLVLLEVELDFIDAYIFLLNIRFLGKIEITISVSDESRNLLILPLALQLLIENAIKHNSMSKKSPLKIDIYDGPDRVLHVRNNLRERESYMASTGVGLNNIEHRYRLLEKPAPRFFKTASTFEAEITLITQ